MGKKIGSSSSSGSACSQTREESFVSGVFANKGMQREDDFEERTHFGP